MPTQRTPFPLRLLLRPRYWAVLLAAGLGRIATLLPMAAMPALSRPLAWALWRWPKFRHVTRSNLRACFPGLADPKREALARASTREVATSVLVSVKTWFSYRPGHPDFAPRFSGLEHFEAARDTGRGIILLNFHYGSTELNGALTAQLPRGDRRFTGLYRRPSNAGADAVLHWARTAFCDRILPAAETRAIARGLREGDLMWFATDLEVSGPGKVWADFFGTPAATSTSLARLAGVTGAIVLPARLGRAEDGRPRLEILPPLRGFPSGDRETDATTMNNAIAELIAEDPAPYWWCLERFRKRPKGAPPVY